MLVSPYYYFEYANVLVFMAVGIAFFLGSQITSWIVRPNKPYAAKLSPYECGEPILGSAFARFNIRFYIIALIFIVFDVEVVVLFPWAVVYKDLGLFAFGEMLVFLLILIVGYVYVWRRGDLEWIKPPPGSLDRPPLANVIPPGGKFEPTGTSAKS